MCWGCGPIGNDWTPSLLLSYAQRHGSLLKLKNDPRGKPESYHPNYCSDNRKNGLLAKVQRFAPVSFSVSPFFRPQRRPLQVYVDRALVFLLQKLHKLVDVWEWARQPQNLLVIVVCIAVLAWFSLKMARRTRRKPFTLKIRDPRKAHRWQPAEYTDKPTYCNACMKICLSGSFCEACGICLCTRAQCMKMAGTVQSCKPLSSREKNERASHFWVKGNLPLCSFCFKCLNPCGNLPRLADFRCVWCQKTAHEDCVVEIEEEGEEREQECTMGPHQSMLIPPTSVTLGLEGWRGRRR